jgi:hypothetical protein
MSQKNNANQLIEIQLLSCISQLELAASSGQLNTLCARKLANVASLLNQQEVVRRACHLLAAAPDGAFYAGILTNVKLPKTPPKSLRTIDPIDKIESAHPPFSEVDLIRSISLASETSEHLAFCLAGRFQEAKSTAKAGLDLEEVGDTLAILQQFETAFEIARDPALDEFRRSGVLLVLMIELFRSGRVEESLAILADFESTGIDGWTRIQLALGFAGRVPWQGYPFPDW